MNIYLIVSLCSFILIILFALFIFLGRAGLCLEYSNDGGIKIKIKVLGIKFKIKPSIIKKETAQVKETVAKTENDNSEIGLDLDILKKTVKLLSYTRYKFTFKKISIKIQLGAGDAAKTAISCGLLYTAVYTVLGGFQNMYFIEKPHVEIIPAFNTIDLRHEYYFELSGRLISILKIAFKAYKIYNSKEK